jgi:hypothetical protein
MFTVVDLVPERKYIFKLRMDLTKNYGILTVNRRKQFENVVEKVCRV